MLILSDYAHSCNPLRRGRSVSGVDPAAGGRHIALLVDVLRNRRVEAGHSLGRAVEAKATPEPFTRHGRRPRVVRVHRGNDRLVDCPYNIQKIRAARGDGAVDDNLRVAFRVVVGEAKPLGVSEQGFVGVRVEDDFHCAFLVRSVDAAFLLEDGVGELLVVESKRTEPRIKLVYADIVAAEIYGSY